MRHYETTSFSGMAYIILKNYGKPMNSLEILKRILKRKPTSGKTPYSTLRSSLLRDKRFKRKGRSLYGLSEWDGN
jgi:hypothetical protein